MSAARGYASYLPRHQVARLAGAEAPDELPQEPRVDALEAALLLADLSGFTPLTERHAAKGAAGAEAVSQLLNRFFGRTSALVHAHGGDVLLFAGDAVLAMWPAAGDLDAATALAAQCALALQDPAAGDPEPAEIRKKVAIGAGRLSVLELGGVGERWQTLFAGDAIQQLDAPNRLARPGDVAPSPAAWQRLRAASRVAGAWSSGTRLASLAHPVPARARGLPEVSPELEDRLRSHLPELVVERVEAGLGDWLAEFRNVTVVFAGLAGIDVEDPGQVPRLQEAVVALQDTIGRYDGTLYQLLMDEKGLCCVAAFGLPGHTHEDDGLRALDAALALRTRLGDASVASSIGVASGPAFCGTCGDERRRQYNIVGPPINLASRLMQAARDDVLCDAATADRARARVALEELPRISVKGRDEPIAVFRPRGRVRAPQPERRRSLLGRAAERERLVARLHEVREGRGGAVAVEGEPGIGKSHLLHELAARAREEDVAVLEGAGDAIETRTPYYPWREVLGAALGGGSRSDAEALQREILARLGLDERMLAWAPVLNDVVPLPLPENEITKQMEGVARAQAVQDLMVHLLGQCAAHPTLLILEDAHWFDSSSLALALRLVRSVPRLLVVVGTRPVGAHSPPGLGELVGAAGVDRLGLQGLAPEAIPELVGRRIGADTLAEPVTRLILERAEGNPLHSEELALALRDAGLLVVEEGVCRLAREAASRAAAIPTTLQAAITSRIDRLDSGEQLLLKAASVIGRVFVASMLREVHPVRSRGDAVAAQLANLEAQDIIRLDRADRDPVYRFKHVITRDVTYQLMLDSQRRPLHRRVAERLEDRHRDDLAPHFPLLAHHWEEAGDVPHAVDYLERAGEQALARFSNREAHAHVAHAVELCEREALSVEAERRARWEHVQAEALTKRGEYDPAGPHLLRALTLRGMAAPVSPPGLVASLAGQVARQLVHRLVGPREPRSEAERAARLFESQIHVRWAETGYVTNDALRSIHSSFRSLNAAELACSTSERVNGYGALAVVLGLAGLNAASHWYGQKAIALAAGEGSLVDLAFARLLSSLHEIRVGNWSFVDEACSEACVTYERLGDRRRWETCASIRCNMLLGTGAFAEADHRLDAVWESARDDVSGRIWARAGQLTARLPRLEPAAEVLEELDELSAQAASGADGILGRGMLALAWLRRGEPARALEQADATLAIALRSRPTVYYDTWPLSGAAEVYLARLEAGAPARDDLLARARRLCGVMRGFAFMNPMARPRLALAEGRLAWVQRRPERARRHWRRALASAERLGMPHERGLAHLELGRHLPQGAPARSDHLGAALTVFAELGAERDRDRVRTHLD